MKISISGSQNSGKSTFIEGLKTSKKIKDYKFIESPSRKIATLGYKLNENSTAESQFLILEQSLKDLEIEGNVIYDRSILDVYVYSKYLYLNCILSRKDFEKIENEFIKNIRKIDYIVLLEPLKKIEDNGIRSLDTDYQNNIHEIFKFVLKKFKLKSIEKNSINDIII